MSDTVKCDRCQATFTAFCNSQAHGCDTSVSDGELDCHYGSRFDLSSFEIVDAGAVPGQSICDGCIEVLIAAGSLGDERCRMADMRKGIAAHNAAMNDGRTWVSVSSVFDGFCFCTDEYCGGSPCVSYQVIDVQSLPREELERILVLGEKEVGV